MSQFDEHQEALENIEYEMKHSIADIGDQLFIRPKMKKIGSRCEENELRSKTNLIDKLFEKKYVKDLAKYYLDLSKTPTHKNSASTRHNIKIKLLEFKDEVKLFFLKHIEHHQGKHNNCNYVNIVNHYFREKDRDILRSRVKESLFVNTIQATPKPSIFNFFTRKTQVQIPDSSKTPSRTLSRTSSKKLTVVAGKNKTFKKNRRNKTNRK